MQAMRKKGLLLSTSADTLRVQVRTLCVVGGQRVLPGERELPRATADQAIRDGFAVGIETKRGGKLSKRPEGIRL